MKNFKMILSIGLVLIIIFAAFLPSLENGFVNWDDDVYVTRNPLIRDLTAKGISRIFTPASYLNLATPQHYVPLVFLSYAFEYHFSRLNPFVYHATNLILHLLNSLLVFWFILLLGRSLPVALLAAILFGVHPLRVESVAWVTERKDLLCAFFFLAALVSYIYYLKKGRERGYYNFVIVLFMLALLSKPLAISLPLVLLVIDYFINGKINKNNLWEKIVLFAIALAYLSIYMPYIKTYAGEGPPSAFLDKILIANYIIAFNLYKLIFPLRLSAAYPHPLDSNNALSGIFWLSPLVTIGLFFIVWYSRKYTKKLILGSALFLITASPYLFVLASHRIAADRFTYLPAVGTSFVVAVFVAWLYRRKIKYQRIAGIVLSLSLAVPITALSILTRDRCKVWKDSIVLWSDVLKEDPAAAIAYHNRGAEYLTRKEYGRAHKDFMSALQLLPNSPDTYFNLASLYNATGDYKEAIRHCRKAIELNPQDLEAHGLLVVLYGKLDNHAEVITISKKMIRDNPGYALGYCYLCGAYGNIGNYREAIVACQKALEIDPNLALAHINLSAAYYYRKQYHLAIRHCDRAIELGGEVSPEFLSSLKPHRK